MKAVIARYNENTDWIKNLEIPYLIFNKGEDITDLNNIKRPNVGKEAETYLHFIISNYDTLEGHYAFLQGDPFDHTNHTFMGFQQEANNTLGSKDDFINYLNNFKMNNDYTPLGNWYRCNMQGQPHFGFDFKTELKEFFLEFPTNIWYIQGAQFIASAEAIKSRSWWFYKKLLARSMLYGQNIYAHVLERMWPLIMTPHYKARL